VQNYVLPIDLDHLAYIEECLCISVKTLMVLATVMLLTIVPISVMASHSVSPNACYNDGQAAGEEDEFSQELYEFCGEYGEEYYQGFIDGCMSVEGNTRDVCESATDAD
jgi:hypothetical protein